MSRSLRADGDDAVDADSALMAAAEMAAGGAPAPEAGAASSPAPAPAEDISVGRGAALCLIFCGLFR